MLGQARGASTRLPRLLHMLEAFMAGDRGFKRGRRDANRLSSRAAIPKG
ncbi:DUF2274 domain-containing protein [Pseudothauera rhizosphaerae]|nr:DUF2274 domain-containing protein [Pseudothauera rhizosphaerae]